MTRALNVPAPDFAGLGKNPVTDYIVSRLREERRRRGISAKEVAELAGIPRGSYGALEAGSYRLSVENLFRVLGVLGMDASDVWPRWERAETPRRVTEEKIAAAIRRNRARRPRLPSRDEILDVLCAEFGVSVETVLGPGKHRATAQVRAVAALLVNESHHLTLTSLARRLGRSVSSLSHSVTRLRKLMESDRKLAGRIRRIRRRLKLQQRLPSARR